MIVASIYESNDCHTPAGTPAGGQFCATSGVLTNVHVHGPREPYPLPGGAKEVPDGWWVVTSDQGFVELSASRRYTGPHLVVMQIYVKEDLRGQSFGQQLYQQAVKAAKEIGKTSWPRYRGVVSGAEVRSTAASRAWGALKRKYPKKVKTVRMRGTTYEVME